jgi:hypothetical protein
MFSSSSRLSSSICSSSSSSSNRLQLPAWWLPSSRLSVGSGNSSRTLLSCQWCLIIGLLVCLLTTRFCGGVTVHQAAVPAQHGGS